MLQKPSKPFANLKRMEKQYFHRLQNFLISVSVTLWKPFYGREIEMIFKAWRSTADAPLQQVRWFIFTLVVWLSSVNLLRLKIVKVVRCVFRNQMFGPISEMKNWTLIFDMEHYTMSLTGLFEIEIWKSLIALLLSICCLWWVFLSFWSICFWT